MESRTGYDCTSSNLMIILTVSSCFIDLSFDLFCSSFLKVTNGKNAMPAFGERLGPDDIEDVANYVIDQANRGWPQPQVGGHIAHRAIFETSLSKTAFRIQVVPGRAGGGSFRRKKNYIAKKEFAYRMCARRPTSAMPKPFLCCERAFCCSMVVM